jgi:glycosyltransferase involved in cell wall biosynthesis
MQKVFNVLLTTMSLDIGGAETHVIELAKGLKKEGFHVIVASKGGVFVKDLENCGIKHYIVPLHNKKPNNVYKSYKLLKKIIVEEKIDLVHAHARIPGFICNMLHNKMGFAFVTTAHGTWKTSGGLKYITRWGQKTVTVSEDVKSHLLQNYPLDEKNVTVTINGIDTERFSPEIDCRSLQSEFEVSEDGLKVVYVSRLDKDRELILRKLLEVIPMLLPHYRQLQFFIVGGGTLYFEIQAAANRINNEFGRNAVLLTGPRTDINRFTSMADLFIGFGRSSLEAMAASSPVIIAGNQGYLGLLTPDTIDHAMNTNFSGRGKYPLEAQRLYEDIKEVAAMSKEERKSLGSFCRNAVEEKYSVNRMVADNIDIYMELLKKD